MTITSRTKYCIEQRVFALDEGRASSQSREATLDTDSCVVKATLEADGAERQSMPSRRLCVAGVPPRQHRRFRSQPVVRVFCRSRYQQPVSKSVADEEWR
jgi:hypothetical protein